MPEGIAQAIEPQQPTARPIDDAAPERKPLVPPKGDSDEAKSKVVGALTDLFDRAYNYRALFNELWTTCVAFYEGQQWVRWNPLSFQLQYDRRVPFHMKPLVENRIQGTVDHANAIITSEDPILTVPPSSTDEEARNRSEAATAIVGKLMKMLETPRWNRLAAKWLLLTGLCIVESEWDKYAPPYRPKMGFTVEGWMPIPKMGPDGKPVLGPDGKPVPAAYEPTGALRRNLYTSFETFPDPGSTGPDDADWVFLVASMDPEEVYRRFSYRPKGVKDGTASNGVGTGVAGRVGQILQRAFGLFGEGFSYSTTAAGLSRAVDVLKFYQAPCEEAPAGRCIVMIEGEIVYDDVCETRGNFRWPFTVFTFREHGKRWFPNGMVAILLDVQREMNRTLSRYAETLSLMGNPRITVPRGLGINKESWTNKPGLVLEYDVGPDGAKPEVMEGVTLPSSVQWHMDRLEKSFKTLSGIEDALAGQLPSSDTSGVAIKALQGKNLQRLAPVGQGMHEGWAKVAKYELWLAGQNWPEKMKIAAVGRNGKPMLVDFDKTDFASPIEIQVENGSALPQDAGQRQAVLNSMFGPGGPMVTLPKDLRRFYLSLSKHGADLVSFYEEEDIYESRTREQIRAALRGERQFVNYNTDHKTARRVISMAMESQDFIEATDDKKALVVDLDEQHAMYDQMPKDPEGIVLPPDLGQLGMPPGTPPQAPPPNPQQVQAAVGMPPTAPPAPSAPKAQPA